MPGYCVYAQAMSQVKKTMGSGRKQHVKNSSPQKWTVEDGEGRYRGDRGRSR